MTAGIPSGEVRSDGTARPASLLCAIRVRSSFELADAAAARAISAAGRSMVRECARSAARKAAAHAGKGDTPRLEARPRERNVTQR